MPCRKRPPPPPIPSDHDLARHVLSHLYIIYTDSRRGDESVKKLPHKIICHRKKKKVSKRIYCSTILYYNIYHVYLYCPIFQNNNYTFSSDVLYYCNCISSTRLQRLAAASNIGQTKIIINNRLIYVVIEIYQITLSGSKQQQLTKQSILWYYAWVCIGTYTRLYNVNPFIIIYSIICVEYRLNIIVKTIHHRRICWSTTINCKNERIYRYNSFNYNDNVFIISYKL